MERIIKIMKMFNIKINGKKLFKFGSNLAKFSSYTSVNVTEIYYDQFNLISYLICTFHLFALILLTLGSLLLIRFDVLWNLIDNEFLPENSRSLAIVGVVLLVITIACRVDAVIAE